jgi:hypothetical protein
VNVSSGASSKVAQCSHVKITSGQLRVLAGGLTGA